jgi:hypothetical protein
MTPEEIDKIVKEKLPQLTPTNRTNPDGFAFWLGQPRGGPNTNRIFRAVARGSGQCAEIKLAVTARLNLLDHTLTFAGDEEELLALINGEIALFDQHFAGG